MDQTTAQVEKSILLIFCPQIGPSQKTNGPQLVSANAAFFGRNLRKTISPRLSSKSTSGYAAFSENLIASRVAQQLLESLSMVFIFSSGLHGMTERKIKSIEVSFEPETRSNRNAKYYYVLQTNYSTKTSPYFSMGYNFKCHKNNFYRLTIHPSV